MEISRMAEKDKKVKSEGKPESEKPKQPKEKPAEKRIKQVIRLVETNLDGDRPVEIAIRSIKGISFMFSNAVILKSGFEGRKLGELSDQEMKTLEDIIINPERHGIPAWLYNRKSEPATGEDRHLTVSRLELTYRTDINEMKKLRTYKGIRHQLGLPVRGQRTKSSFRKGGIVGVKKKKEAGGKK